MRSSDHSRLCQPPFDLVHRLGVLVALGIPPALQEDRRRSHQAVIVQTFFYVLDFAPRFKVKIDVVMPQLDAGISDFGSDLNLL